MPKNLNIMVIEDEPDWMQNILFGLDVGYDHLSVKSLDMPPCDDSWRRYDVIICDNRIFDNEYCGIEFLVHCRKDGFRNPLILYSAFIDNTTRLKAGLNSVILFDKEEGFPYEGLEKVFAQVR